MKGTTRTAAINRHSTTGTIEPGDLVRVSHPIFTFGSEEIGVVESFTVREGQPYQYKVRLRGMSNVVPFPARNVTAL